MRQSGAVVSRDWDVVLPAVRKAVEAEVSRRPHAVAAIISPWATVEEAYLLASYLKGQSEHVSLALGPVRTVGEDRYAVQVVGKKIEVRNHSDRKP